MVGGAGGVLNLRTAFPKGTPEGQAWLGAISRVAARKGRDSARDSLPAFVQSLVVFFTAGNVLVAHGAA